MLKELLPILHKGDTLGLSIACEDNGVFRVNVIPRLFTLDGEKGPHRAALNQPLVITGTADELDSPEFVATLTKFSTSVTETRHSLEEVAESHKKAVEDARAASKPETAKTKITPAPAAAKPGAPAPAKSWRDRAVTAGAAPAKAAVAAEPEAPKAPKSAVEATKSII